MSDLIDREALDRAFTQLRFGSDGKLAHWGDRKDWCLHGSEVEKLISDAPTVPAPRWVRCEDELPKRGRLVLAYRGPIAMISAMYTDGCGWRDADLFPMQGVTHWMPLPEPPKEVQDGQE